MTGDADTSARKRFFNQAAQLTPLVAVQTEGGMFAVDTGDLGVGRKLFVNRTRPELELLALALEALEQSGNARRARTGSFVDIGANIGTTTVPALTQHRFSTAVAVEPEPRNLRLLLANLGLNGLHDRVRSFGVALSDSPGRAGLDLSRENSGDHRLLTTTSSSRGEVIEVEVLTLDGLLAGAGLRPQDVGVLWIDVQGREGHVLAGAASVLRHRPAIVFEFWPSLLEEVGGPALLIEALSPFYDEAIDLRGTRGDRLARVPVHELARVDEPTEFLLAPSR